MNYDKMSKAVGELERYFGDRFFAQNIAREIAQLREAIDSGDAEAIEEAIGETVDGCDTALSRIWGAWVQIDAFDAARETN